MLQTISPLAYKIVENFMSSYQQEDIPINTLLATPRIAADVFYKFL
jgi:hypothetical protein